MRTHERAAADQLASEARDELPRLLDQVRAVRATAGSWEEAFAEVALSLTLQDARGVALLASAALMNLLDVIDFEETS